TRAVFCITFSLELDIINPLFSTGPDPPLCTGRNNISQYCLCFSITDREIAFSAALFQPGKGGNVGPFTTEITLIYRNVFTNIGNAYNPTTGIFTAPLKGAYMFNFSVYGHWNPSTPSTVSIVKNEQRVVVAHGHQDQYAVNSSKGVVLILEVGDVVYVRLWSGRKIYDNEHNHITFSGYLLFPLR
uniref:C1q domain-containing protein n=1 Tax=Sinocyclocheilus grahami TaxID=75366 RepID=A0A672M7C8_SINGR